MPPPVVRPREIDAYSLLDSGLSAARCNAKLRERLLLAIPDISRDVG
jgi:hypothetical protein